MRSTLSPNVCGRHVLFVVLLLLLTVATRLTLQFSASSTQQQRGGDEICETLPSEIHLIKGLCRAKGRTGAFG